MKKKNQNKITISPNSSENFVENPFDPKVQQISFPEQKQHDRLKTWATASHKLLSEHNYPTRPNLQPVFNTST